MQYFPELFLKQVCVVQMIGPSGSKFTTPGQQF